MTVVVVVVVVIINGIFACFDIFSNGKHWATLNVITYTLIAENLKKIYTFFVHEIWSETLLLRYIKEVLNLLNNDSFFIQKITNLSPKSGQ